MYEEVDVKVLPAETHRLELANNLSQLAMPFVW